MRSINTDVVVIGGGATGVGVVRDAAMRGFRTVLVDRADLAQGTTGRYHGLLHSGGRYVISDPRSATECAVENAIIRRINASAVEATGGLFVSTPGDDPEYPDQFLTGARETGVQAEEIPISLALQMEPRVNPGITRAIKVQDGSVDGWQMVWGVANSAKEYGAQIFTYHEVTAIIRDQDAVRQVKCVDRKTGEQLAIDCMFVVNCAGAWAGQVAAMAGCHDVQVVPGRGIMIAMNHRLVNTVVNQLTYPSDGDIIVPVHTVSIIGTTDVKAENPDKLTIPANEVQQMLAAGEKLIPGFRQCRAAHAWAGARPLVKDTRVSASDTRHMSRGMSILDHAERDGLHGLLTISGGKLTTYRLMAEHAVDEMCKQLGEQRACRTATEAVPGSESGSNYLVTHRLKQAEQVRSEEQIICECELLTRKSFLEVLRTQPDANLDDIRRQTRLGMGPCQGGFCSSRAAGLALYEGIIDVNRATNLLELFIKNRWIGIWPILYGQQVRQTALDQWIFTGTLDIEHLPTESEVL